MSLIFEKLSQNIIINPKFIKDKQLLFDFYIKHIIGNDYELERHMVKRLLKSIQILCKSNNKELKDEGFVLLSILLDITKSIYPDIKPIANSLFIESGYFPNITLLNNMYSEIQIKYNVLTKLRYLYKEAENTVESLDYKLTDYQKVLWDKLNQDEDIITIAPTSAGKTHIILTYLINQIIASEECFVAIIVPTRALISEVSTKVYELIENTNIEICTIPQRKQFNNKTIFIMTQERLYEQLSPGDLSFNYLFIDEAHNITDESRGVLLHLTIEKLLENRIPQIIISMPSTNYKSTFNTVFQNINFHLEETDDSPVSKIILNVNLNKRNIEISRYQSDNKVLIPKGFTGDHLSNIVYRLGQNQSNIIYQNKTSDCEKTADKIASLISNFVTPAILEEAASYVEEFIHDKFSLANNIRKGVVFHYGPLPSSLRIMIENLAKAGEINYICCTSTLAEGVNLPAKNLFLKNPLQIVAYEDSQKLEQVKIKNIIGRAGRMLEHFSGNIFLIEPESWKFKDYFDKDDIQPTQIPSYYKIINEHIETLIDIFTGKDTLSIDSLPISYTVSNKLIKEFINGTLQSNTFESKDLTISRSNQNKLKEAIQKQCNSMKIPPFILEANPTIGYIQQNALFDFLNNQDDLTQWVLDHPKSPEFYKTFVRVLNKLEELGLYMNNSHSHEYITIISRKWILGKGLKEIINEQIKNDEKYKKNRSINSSVRDVITIINNEIRFRLKNVLGCYHELLSYTLRLKKIDIQSVMLHSYIEVGACDTRMINLINLGLSREAAYEVHRKLDEKYLIETIHDLKQVSNDHNLFKSVHPIIKKEVSSLI